MPSADPRVLVIGAGSIGTRHARNLVALGAAVDVTDPDSGRAAAVGSGARPTDYDLGRLPAYDGIIVASPSSFHLEHARWALTRAGHVFVEKPLAITGASLPELVATGGQRLMVGYNLRFHTPVQRLMELVHEGRAGRIVGARVWFGSYLPDWRPHEDYRTTYSAQAALGGGVLLDAIHELDLVVWLLPGTFSVIAATVERRGDLDIDVEDSVNTLMRHESGAIVDLSLDYLSRRYRRGLEVTGTGANITLDWATAMIHIDGADGSSQEATVGTVDQSYQREMRCFLEWMQGGAEPPVVGPAGAQSVLLADAIRAAAS